MRGDGVYAYQHPERILPCWPRAHRLYRIRGVSRFCLTWRCEVDDATNPGADYRLMPGLRVQIILV